MYHESNAVSQPRVDMESRSHRGHLVFTKHNPFYSGRIATLHFPTSLGQKTVGEVNDASSILVHKHFPLDAFASLSPSAS